MLSEDDLHALLPEFEVFHRRFGRFFRRSESRGRSRDYLVGLLSSVERKNVENIAEWVGVQPRRLQEFVSESPWDDGGCIGELQGLVGERIGMPDGVLAVDDTGFGKKGKCSAGVGRQYSGTLGRTENCQVGVFMNYATAKGHTLVDRRLYLLKHWFEERAELSPRAGLPEGLEFKTKHELAIEMLRAAKEAGHLLFRWVGADADYGDDHDFRQAVADLRAWYCLAVSKTTEVWNCDPGWRVPAPGRGRPPRHPRPAAGSPPPITVAELVASLPKAAWVRHRVTEGARGPREYRFVCLRVVERRHGKPGPWGWLIARRPVVPKPGEEVKYYLSNAPEEVGLKELAWVACLRWTIEEDFETSKGETGLDHYEVTKHRGWYHHTALVLMALAFLRLTQHAWAGEKSGGRRQRGGDPRAVRGGAASARVVADHRDRLVPGPAASQAGSAG